MLWILVTVLVGLVVIIVQLLLAYQKRAARLRVAQNPVRKQIGQCRGKIEDVGKEIRSLAGDTLVDLKRDLSDFQRRSGYAANLTAELDPEAQEWVAARAGEDAEVDTSTDPDGLDEEDEEIGVSFHDDIDDILGGRQDHHHRVGDLRANPVELVRAIRRNLEETYDTIESLRTDANLVQQSLNWLGDDKKERKEGSNGSA